MLAGIRAVCSCGAAFPLPREAFESGMPCPGCGSDITREALAPYRPTGATRFARNASIVLMALLALVRLSLIARPYLSDDFDAQLRFCEVLGGTLPSVSKHILQRTPVLNGLLLMGSVVVAVAIAVLLCGRGGRRGTMGWPTVLLSVLALIASVGTIHAHVFWLPLMDLIRSPN